MSIKSNHSFWKIFDNLNSITFQIFPMNVLDKEKKNLQANKILLGSKTKYNQCLKNLLSKKWQPFEANGNCFFVFYLAFIDVYPKSFSRYIFLVSGGQTCLNVQIRFKVNSLFLIIIVFDILTWNIEKYT